MESKKAKKTVSDNKDDTGADVENLSSEQPIECVFADMSERLMKIQRDLLMPAFIFEQEKIQNTITFFGASRIKPEEVAKKAYEDAKKRGGRGSKAQLEAAKMAYEMSKYYTAACELARRLQEWFNMLPLPNGTSISGCICTSFRYVPLSLQRSRT